MPAEAVTIASLLRDGVRQLQLSKIDDPQRDARLLLMAAAGLSRERLIADEQKLAPPDIVDAFQAMLQRRALSEPVGRIIGSRAFYGLELALSPQVLEPRDDTGALVDLVLDTVTDKTAPLLFADLGTGSGAIALSVLSCLPKAHCVATDISPEAVETATANADRLGLTDRLSPRCGSWFEPLAEDRALFDFIVSNPPYIATREIASLQREVRDHDPHRALDGGSDGLAAYRILLAGAASHLEPEGFLALEIGHDQSAAVCALAESEGWCLGEGRSDLAMRDRALCFYRAKGRESAV